ncbi:MAG: DUF4091 domain-containing protein [Pirellulales bacterium]|nr:DUF4091 domain-containing protein [Pirellulales bacterium]
MLKFVTALIALLVTAVAYAEPLLPNPDFTEGNGGPTGWKLTGGEGRWVDRQFVEVTGAGKDANEWRCEASFQPGKLYHFQMRARRPGGSGLAVSGPSFANRDFSSIPGEWRWFDFVCRAPDHVASGYVRVGQWQTTGTTQFDAVRLVPALAVHRTAGGLLLGEGESILGGQYRFSGTFAHQGSNYHRTLVRSNAWFNSDRWCFGDGNEVVYRFGLPGHRFLSGEVKFSVNYHTGGGCVAEISRDGQKWHALATQETVGDAGAQMPTEVLPTESFLLRLRAVKASNFQVNRIEFQGHLSDPPTDATGETVYADLESTSPQVSIESMTLGDGDRSGRTTVTMVVKNSSPEAAKVSLMVSLQSPGKEPVDLPAEKTDIPAGKSAPLAVSIPVHQPGEHRVALSLSAGSGEPLRASLAFSVPDYYRTDYGELLSGGTGDLAVWWCDATRKVPRTRPAPAKTSKLVQIAAACNDWEGFQIVVRPDRPLKGLTARPGPIVLRKSDRPAVRGILNTISAENVRVLRVYYHFVDHPTDRTGIRDWWPDALPPLNEPIDVAAGVNQPLWIVVYVPDIAKPGEYEGEVVLEAEGWSATVPIRLKVWGFSLPERNHLATAFGFSPGEAFRYHQVRTEEDKRKLLDLYFQSFAEHRISPYDPTPLDPIRVKFVSDASPPRAEVDFSAFDPAMARAVEQYRFTHFRLHLDAMGGGTFHERYEPKIGDYGEATPQYQAMFSSYAKQLDGHLKEKGWLDMAYVYWFDEPDPKDYGFVRSGMERIKRHAPGIQTMLTEEPNDALAGPVDIWCPVTPNYDHEPAEKRRAEGDRFWWYVCTGPKAPYCTLFIDHPATELRVWHWQTWQRKIVGTLVWQSNYWTSSAAFPDKPQNPYEDPMGYVSGYSTPRGTKRFWGNGDGRFIYPPLAAAVPGASGSGPVLEPPVSSIRWEMLREGVEDYEFLHLLREKLDARRSALSPEQIRQYEALLEVPASITSDMTTFTTDSAPIYERRAAIAAAIEQLQK